jgi:hypothetical protein
MIGGLPGIGPRGCGKTEALGGSTQRKECLVLNLIFCYLELEVVKGTGEISAQQP